MGVSLIFLRRARPGIDLRIFGWVCVYAPTWPGISFWEIFPDLRSEKWGGVVGGGDWVRGSRVTTSRQNFRESQSILGHPKFVRALLKLNK